LQTEVIYFDADQTALLAKMNELAKQLGGRMSPPARSWKYSVIKKMVGWRMAKKAQQAE
jgi:hypothetical protein